MNESTLDLEKWLIAETLNESRATSDDWDAGFDVDRQIVYSKFGPYKKFFLRPEKFTKRFYHTLYPLSLEEWQCTDQIKLYDDFCTMDLTLDVKFQATYSYALRNIELLAEINEHIKNVYYGQVMDIVNRELLNLSDGSWVQQGLKAVENKISISVSEMLILQNIQSQVICKLKPSFKEFPDVQFAKESVYLCVLKKSFEFNELQNDELFRQQQAEEKQKIGHKRKQAEQLNEIAELDSYRQAQQAENSKHLLEEKEQQQLEHFEINTRIHEETIAHNNKLKRMSLEAELEENERQQERLRVSEEREKIEFIELHKKINKKELEAEVTKYENEQASWREAKNKIYIEDLDLKHRQKQLEFDTDVGYKRRYEQQRAAMQEESYAIRKSSDIYLKREIELLELEKQRLSLELSIKNSKEKNHNNIETE